MLAWKVGSAVALALTVAGLLLSNHLLQQQSRFMDTLPNQHGHAPDSLGGASGSTIAIAVDDPKRTQLTKVQPTGRLQMTVETMDSCTNHTPHDKHACVEYMYFFHVRKAGGTTLQKLVNRAVHRANITRIAEEGVKFDHVKFKDERALFVTSLRDPLTRIRSAYEFEGYTKGSILEWVNATLEWNAGKHRRRKLWSCVSDCYCRWFGSNRSNPEASRAEQCELAFQTICSFDVVHFNEEWSVPTAWKRLVDALGLDILELPKALHYRATKKVRGSKWDNKTNTWHQQNTKQASFDKEWQGALPAILELNKNDIKLFTRVWKDLHRRWKSDEASG